MPVSDWTRVKAGSFRDFRDSWISQQNVTLIEGVLTLLMVIAITGCGRQERATISAAATEVEQAVIEQVASIVARDTADITPSTSFGELGIDDLDLVEIVMALEDRFLVTIPDSSLDALIAANDTSPVAPKRDATIRDLAAIIPPLLTHQTAASGNSDGNHEK